MSNGSPLRRWLLLLVVAVVIGGGIGAYLYFRDQWPPEKLPGPETAEYKKYVKAFYVGVVALQAGLKEAESNLEEAVNLIPQEPAGLANRGLMHLRAMELKKAADDLHRANKLAPESSQIEALLALLYERLGKEKEAVAHYEKAVQNDPGNAALLQDMAELVKKDTSPEGRAKYLEIMDKILTHYPKNQHALMDKARAECEAKAFVALKVTLGELSEAAPAWAPKAQNALQALRKTADEGGKDLFARYVQLRNYLNRELIFQQAGYVLGIQPETQLPGTPVWHFLRLQPLRPSPAPPDRELTFQVEPRLGGAKNGSYDHLQILWRLNEKRRVEIVDALRMALVGPQSPDVLESNVFLVSGDKVRAADGGDQSLPFPAGTRPPSAAGILAVDLNGDIRQDLVLAGVGGLRFWERQAKGNFLDVTKKTGLPETLLQEDYYGAWTADTDSDGDMDVVVARHSGPVLLLRNNGDGAFKALETFALVQKARGFAWADLDADGAPDAAFLDAGGRLHLYSNERGGGFRPWTLPEDIGTFLAITAADIDGDGRVDLVALRSDGALMRISNKGKRESWDVAELARLSEVDGLTPENVALFVADVDNNGGLDVIVAGPEEAHIFLADEQRKLTKLAGTVAMRVCAVVDLNNDGKLDFLGLSKGGHPVAGINQSTKKYQWQTVYPLAKPETSADRRINSFGIGGEIDMIAGTSVQKQVINSPVLHYGLGDELGTAVARFVWPNGSFQWEIDLPTDTVIVTGQRLGSSCPFLFTYDGTDMQFAGDFMWNTPLGMYINGINTGPVTQTTEWLKIRGNQLVPRNGCYDVRVHANLHETDYFDQLALIVVDHPPGTEIHVDERFSPKPTPPWLQVTTPARPVARAWDHKGQDVTDIVRAIDGVYLDHAGRGEFQGVTVDHWVEADLGDDYPKTGPVWLIARGWTHPTDSSINLALSQGKHDLPRPLDLEIPDGKGGWKVAQQALGFPAGKNKTMLIRLDGIEGPGVVSRRFRLRTNMEIYWDYLGFAQGLETKLAKMQRPAMLAADLRYKGILEMVQKNRSSPEVPLYNRVSHLQAWRDLTGFYTRFGDVRELLAKVDDRYVIMNAGDEIALRFAVPEDPAAGWVRDFIWECDGWTRDGNHNTQFGTTVIPLPAHDLKELKLYPGGLEADPVYLRFPDDWKNYHTRYVTPYRFAQGLRALLPPERK